MVTILMALPAGSVPRNNGGLYIAISVEHWTQHPPQSRQGGFAGYVIGRTNFLFCNQRERTAYGFRGMVESCFERDFRVMQAIGIELHLGPTGATAKEIDRAAFAYHVNRPLPSFRTAH